MIDAGNGIGAQPLMRCCTTMASISERSMRVYQSCAISAPVVRARLVARSCAGSFTKRSSVRAYAMQRHASDRQTDLRPIVLVDMRGVAWNYFWRIVLDGADAMVLVTEWDTFRALDM